MSETVTFQIRVDEGPEQTITVKTGIYQHAAAAVPALLGLDKIPIIVEIWSKDLVPEYGPYFYRVKNNEYGALMLEHLVPVRPDEKPVESIQHTD